MSRQRKLVWRVKATMYEMYQSPSLIEESFFFDRKRAYLEYQKACIKYFDDKDVVVYIEPVEVF